MLESCDKQENSTVGGAIMLQSCTVWISCVTSPLEANKDTMKEEQLINRAEYLRNLQSCDSCCTAIMQSVCVCVLVNDRGRSNIETRFGKIGDTDLGEVWC